MHYHVHKFAEQPFRGHAASQGSMSVGEHWLSWTVDTYSSPLCLFKLPVTFTATQLFHTGRPTGYRGRQPLSWQNRRLLSVEEVVKLHFSMKAMFSGEAAVFPIDPSTKAPQQGFFSQSVIILYNNSSVEKESRLTVLSHHQGLQLKYQSPSKKRIDLRELDSSL